MSIQEQQQQQSIEDEADETCLQVFGQGFDWAEGKKKSQKNLIYILFHNFCLFFLQF